MDFTIRKVEESDAHAIAQILQELGWHQWVSSNPHDKVVSQIQQHISQCAADDSHSVYVAESPQKGVIGYITVHWIPCLFIERLRGYVSDLFIQEDSRGQGVGSKLLAVVISESQLKGCHSVTALTRRERESYKQGFYSKQGWVERGNVVDFIYEIPQLTTSLRS
ncbi:MAG: GNAT family N-acetyltransferase [Nostoc sp. SerVER01]|nr:GNAT family N-acetyltransferase [Nostoc sp. SerVER01]